LSAVTREKREYEERFLKANTELEKKVSVIWRLNKGQSEEKITQRLNTGQWTKDYLKVK
jgi:hypothetical protein